ncbi:hypothetical protein [Loigolactobacillus iwatensis]|nr:hypothetical protein [Loigolactobacillus iwatensis]
MKYTKQHKQKKTQNTDTTWKKFKKQTNNLSAHRRGVRSGGH